MRYFRDMKSGQVYAYETAEDLERFGSPELIAMTEEEVRAHTDLSVSPPTRAAIERARLRAYADPITGSDRYFAEAQRESILGNLGKAESARLLGLARYAEIQAALPWPED